MLCDRCRKNEASVFVKTVLNSQVRQERLCPSCSGVDLAAIESVLPPFMASFGVGQVLRPRRLPAKAESCPLCGATAASFQETGFLGCPDCYAHFAERLPPLLRRIHGRDRHRGKIYGGAA